MAVSWWEFLNVAFWLRAIVLILFSATATISVVAMVKTSNSSYLLGIVLWCLNVVAFTVAAILRAEGIVFISPDVFGIWSTTVRLHGGATVLGISIYSLARRRLL